MLKLIIYLGEVPFASVQSVFGISLFVLLSSQLLGNVAIVQLSRPNVDSLDDSLDKIKLETLIENIDIE